MKIDFMPEEICVEIVTRLPFRTIMRFKAVCREWRSFIETSNFRRKFMFAHRNSSSSWSIMQGTFAWGSGELVGFYGCERYGLPRSLDAYLPPHNSYLGDQNVIMDCVDGLVLVVNVLRGNTYSVGNPVLNQWVQLPSLPYKPLTTGLVTLVEDGMVVEYKVVFMNHPHKGHVATLTFDIYSSKTKIWITKQIRCPPLLYCLRNERALSLNKKLHWLDRDEQALVAYDFFAVDEQQQCQVIPFPETEVFFIKAYTISGGFIFYIINISFTLRLWRLEEYTSDSGRWQLMHDISLAYFVCNDTYFPMAMHPFETNIIYMATWDKVRVRTLVSIDLRQTYKVTRHTNSSTYSDTMLTDYMTHDVYSSITSGLHHKVFYAQQFILPQWMESLPSI